MKFFVVVCCPPSLAADGNGFQLEKLGLCFPSLSHMSWKIAKNLLRFDHPE